jgi:YD repeat-containing protein
LYKGETEIEDTNEDGSLKYDAEGNIIYKTITSEESV